MDRLNLIVFSDDNHAERVWIDGVYVGDMSDIGTILKNSINIIKDLNDDYRFEETRLHVYDDFDDIEEDVAEEIWDFFNDVEKITEAQVELIQDKNWEELRKTI